MYNYPKRLISQPQCDTGFERPRFDLQLVEKSRLITKMIQDPVLWAAFLISEKTLLDICVMQWLITLFVKIIYSKYIDYRCDSKRYYNGMQAVQAHDIFLTE
jgi:hypothetical protein